MDPITAISLASSIVSFIDFSWSLVTGSKELYESGCRRTKDNARIGTIIDDLNEYARDLTIGGEGVSKHEKALRALADDCHALAEELVRALQKLESTKKSRWQSLKTSWQSMRKAGDIASIELRLDRYRAQMNIRLLALLSEEQSSIKSQLDYIQNEAEKLSSSSAEELKDLRTNVTTILSKIQDMDRKDDSCSSDDEETEDQEARKQFFKTLGDIINGLSKLEERLRVIPKETRVLQHLYFEDMYSREDTIEPPSRGTFAWLLMNDEEFEQYISSWEDDTAFSATDETTNSQAIKSRKRWSAATTEKMNDSRRLLRNWLAKGEGVFHISGKAGSGKSTLMKFILHNSGTVECLRRWAGEKTLIFASFYFWCSDRRNLQMSLDGLYRSILFGVLRKCPHLMTDVLPDQWRIMSLQSGGPSFESDLFRPNKIKEAFEALMRSPVQSQKFAFCFFIDGLDEYEADAFEHKGLAQHLREWSIRNGIKICVSSRPEIEYEGIFDQTLRLNLHELTTRDIHRSCRDIFEQDPDFPKVKGAYLELLEEVVDKAEGVFIWACLVVKSLLVEVGRDATSERLWQTLNSTPSKLDDLYDGMFRSLNRQDRRIVDYILLLVLTNPFHDPLNAMCLSWLSEAEDFRFPGRHSRYSDREAMQQLEKVRKQLQGQTRGFLVLAPGKRYLGKCPMFSRRVHFFHRTARDYLTTPERKSQLNASFPSFDGFRIHSILRLAELTFINPWNVPYIHELDLYARELLSLRSASLATYQQPYAHMKALEEFYIFQLKCAVAIQGFAHRTVFPPRYHESDTLFLHMAAWHGQIDFVRNEVDAMNDALFKAESPVSLNVNVPPPVRSSLLLSAASGENPAIVSLLLSCGFHSQSLVSVFNKNLMKSRKYVTVWIVIIGHIAYRAFANTAGADTSWMTAAFKIMELFLTAADQVPVVLLLRYLNSNDSITHFTTVEQLVRLCWPPNMCELLALLKTWRGDEREEGANLPLDPLQWAALGGVNLPIYVDISQDDDRCEFMLQGIASDQEILTGLQDLFFRVG